MLNNQVTRAGTLLFKGGIIYIDGWEMKEPAMCREHVIFACMYVAQDLYKAAMANIRAPGGAANTCADMPRETPREWLCKETREFLEPFDRRDACSKAHEGKVGQCPYCEADALRIERDQLALRIKTLECERDAWRGSSDAFKAQAEASRAAQGKSGSHE